MYKKRKNSNTVIAIGTLIILILFIYVHTIIHREKFSVSELRQIQEAKNCYKIKNPVGSIKLLDDILESQPKTGNNIFFIDSACARNGTVTLTPRQACAIESAAKWAPNHDIFVLFISPVGLPPKGLISPVIKALLSYENIHLRNVDWYEYAMDTPAEYWIKTDRILSSEHNIAHLSDFMRFVSIYKYGGTYFDLNFLIQKSLENLSPNFAGIGRNNTIDNSVLRFQSKHFGHKLIEMILRESTENYKSNELTYNGSGSITRVIRKICHKKDIGDLTPEFCSGFKLYPNTTFFPLPRRYWDSVAKNDTKEINKTMHTIQDSIAVFLGNPLSSNQKLDTAKSNAIFKLLAQMHCPKVHSASN